VLPTSFHHKTIMLGGSDIDTVLSVKPGTAPLAVREVGLFV
jgi:hypothetical protein